MSGHAVALRCDADRVTGLGHLQRSLSLAEALLDRGHDVLMVGSVGGLSLAERLVASLDIPMHPTPNGSLLTALDELGASALVIDSYTVPATVHAEVRASGRPVVAIVDAPAPALDADLLVNPNLGSEAAMATPHRGVVLAGPRYALLRSTVTRLRPPTPPEVPTEARRVLVVLGGTDVLVAAPAVTRALLATGMPLDIDVICSTPEIRAQVDSLTRRSGQLVRCSGPVENLAELAAHADLVVSAAGTTVWELACLGRPMAIVRVADNQRSGYAAVVSSGLAVGLGSAAQLTGSPANVVASLTELLQDATLRHRLTASGHALVDGRGRDRIAAAVTALLSGGSVEPIDQEGVI